MPGIARAIELFAVGDSLNARREWYRMTEMQDASTSAPNGVLGSAYGQTLFGHPNRK